MSGAAAPSRTQQSKVTVVVIAKSPVAGLVKTRLCPPCTPDQAADIARAALIDTIDAVIGANVDHRAIALDGSPGDWIPADFRVFPQQGRGLDERLAAAVMEIDGPVVIIGMDTPQVTPQLIDDVVAALGEPSADAVLGLADDGGYWVIALNESRPEALRGVPMSTATTGAAQLERLESLGLRTVVVTTLCDVDTFDEALRVRDLIPESRFAQAVDRIDSAILAAQSVSAGLGGAATVDSVEGLQRV